MPPCLDTLILKIQRATLVANIWARADSHYPSDGLDPCNFGWEQKDETYEPLWYDGAMIPESIRTKLASGSEETDDQGEEVFEYEEHIEDIEWSDDSDEEGEW